MGSALPFLLSGDGTEGAGEGEREAWKQGGPEAAVWQCFQPPRMARATARGQEKLREAVLAAAPQRSVPAWKYISPCK